MPRAPGLKSTVRQRRYQRQWKAAMRAKRTPEQIAEVKAQRADQRRRRIAAMTLAELATARAKTAAAKRTKNAAKRAPDAEARRIAKARHALEKARDTFRPIRIPDSGICPEVRWLFNEMNRQQISITAMAARAGVGRQCIQRMRTENQPVLGNFLACVTVLGCTIAFIPDGYRARLVKERPAAF